MRLEIAKAMLLKGIAPVVVAEVTGLAEIEVAQLGLFLQKVFN